MHRGLTAHAQPGNRCLDVSISKEQSRLKEQHAYGPYRRSPAQVRENHLCDHGLKKKQECRTNEKGGGIEKQHARVQNRRPGSGLTKICDFKTDRAVPMGQPVAISVNLLPNCFQITTNKHHTSVSPNAFRDSECQRVFAKHLS